MKESEVKTKIVDEVRHEGGYARRIEDRFSVGMPDTVMIPLECPVVWIEVKIVSWNTLRPSARQYVELKRLRIAPHSTSYILGWKADKMYIHPPVAICKLDACNMRQPGESFGDFIRRTIMEEANGTRFV